MNTLLRSIWSTAFALASVVVPSPLVELPPAQEAVRTTPAANSRRGFEIRKLAVGVYATIRNESPGLWFDANNVFIVGESDVIVVDANLTAASTRSVLAALRELTDKPVRYVINTHWHEDHVVGNHVYRDAFPAVEFIGHSTTLDDFPTIGARNRAQAIAGASALAQQMRGFVERRVGFTGDALTTEERAAFESDIGLLEQYAAESDHFEVVLPTLTVTDRLTLHRGARTIDVRYLGRAHTRADLVVHLPQDRIVITGDLVAWPVPLIVSTSYPLEYGATLEALLALDAEVIVPGHGPVMRDDSYPQLVLRLLQLLQSQTEMAFARGESLEEARRSIDLGEFRRAIAGDSRHRAFVFDNYVAESAIAAAFRQLEGK